MALTISDGALNCRETGPSLGVNSTKLRRLRAAQHSEETQPMFVHRRRGWEIPENRATRECFLQRRALAKTLAAGPILAASAPLLSASSAFAAADPSAGLYPVGRNPKYTVDRALTPERIATTYNNFYEFGSHKQIHTAAQRLETRPWVVTIDGAVEKPMKIDIDDLLKKMPLEERVYAHALRRSLVHGGACPAFRSRL